MNKTDHQQNGIFIRTTQDAKKDFKVSGFSELRHLKVCNQVLLAAVQPTKLISRSLASSTKQAEIQLPVSTSDSISFVHLSPTGFHAIVSCKSGENFYLHLKGHVATVALKKIKDQITSVAWHPDSLKDTETGHILLGTMKGLIFETNIMSNGSTAFMKEHQTRFIHNDDPAENQIISMRLFIVNDDEPKAAKCVLFVCQQSRLYCLSTMLSLLPVVKSYVTPAALQNFSALTESSQHLFHPFFSPKESQQTCITMPKEAHLPAECSSGLVFYTMSGTYTHPFHFFWLGPHGYSFGTINLGAEKIGDVIKEDKFFEHRRIEGRLECPIGVTITEFHVLLAYSTRLVALSLYTYSVAYEDIWPVDLGCALGITADPVSEFHWLYTASYILKYRPNDEARYVWKVFLDRGDYTRALTVAKERIHMDPEALELVLKRQADKFIAEKNFTAAAEILAQSNEPFETVVLKFLSTDADRRMGLKVLLEKKLDKLGSTNSNEDRMKKDALVMWLMEIQLAELAEARRTGETQAVNDLTSHLQHFILKKNNLDCIFSLKEAVYLLAVSHADFETQLFLAQQFQDYETAISIHMLRQQYREVLDIIKTKLTSVDSVLKYGTVLVDHIPMEFFASFMKNERIRPNTMLPLLYQCQEEKKQAISAIKYMEWGITHPSCVHDPQFHNFLILMYAIHRPNKLYDYLVSRGNEKRGVPYDIDFAVRTCQQFGLTNSLIFLHCVDENFSEAVDMALKINIDEAKKCAKLMEPSEDDFLLAIISENRYPQELRRKIWLKIASFIISNGGSAEECIELLKECNGAISIQDIFPIFPDFTKIDHVKDSLCECLKDHAKTIEEIQRSLKEAADVATQLKEKTEKLKSRVTIVKAGDTCAECHRTLANRPFYPFACRHFFHRECLEQAMQAFLDIAEKKRLAYLIDAERHVLAQLDADDRSPSKRAGYQERENRYEELSQEISELLGAECPHCGSIAIEIINKPFFSEVDYANDQDSW